MIENNQTEQQKKDFFITNQSGVFEDIANMKGARGEVRKELSPKEKAKRKKYKQKVKQCRKMNRG